jgi:3-oxoacyl-[acyl-carrier-protein] synthase-3
MSVRIAALETYLGPDRNEFGAAVDSAQDEIEMAVSVARRAVARLPENAKFDSIIFATCGIRQVFPSGAAAIADALGIDCPGFDVTAGCASMSIAMEVGARMPGSVLVVCSDNLSRTIDASDPSHAPLKSFGDGAAAAVIRRDAGPGPRLLAHRGKTLGRFRKFYGSKDGRLLRSIPADEKKELGEAYLSCWSEIGCELMALCPAGSVPWIYANQGDAKLFPRLAQALGLPEERVVRTEHGHAGGADPWVGLQLQPPPAGGLAILLGSGIGFTFHGTLLEMP